MVVKLDEYIVPIKMKKESWRTWRMAPIAPSFLLVIKSNYKTRYEDIQG